MQPASSHPTEKTLALGDQILAYQCWGATQAPSKTIVALHGWQDNAASFDALAPLLTGNAQVIAVDLAGHGLSYHRSRDSGYNIWQDLKDIAALVEALKLSEFILMGHSRGAIISILYAATFPEQVSKLILLDGFLPEPVPAEEAPRQLARALIDSRILSLKAPRQYPSIDDALRVRMTGRLAMSKDAAKRIASRGLASRQGAYFWRSDLRLKGASEVKLTADHCRAFAEGIRCPCLLLKAADYPMAFDQGLVAANSRISVKTLPGGHHFHLEASHCQAVAEEVLAFLTSENRL